MIITGLNLSNLNRLVSYLIITCEWSIALSAKPLKKYYIINLINRVLNF